jgi:uncharacterized OB-fold protein
MADGTDGDRHDKGEKNARAGPHGIAEYEHAINEEGRLIGFSCQCGFKTLTHVLRCPVCGGSGLKEITLATRGKIISFSVANVPSDLFSKDAPFGYVIVEMDDGSRVSGWMPGVKSPGEIKVGDQVCWKPSYRHGLVIEKEVQQ